VPPVVDYVIVWDLETVPDADAFARVYGLLNPSPSKIHEIIGMEFPKLPLHRIVCIGALIASSSPTGWVVESLGAPHIGERTERELIDSFIGRIGTMKPRLITYNGGSFDLPVLRYRAMLHRISASGLFVREYFNRFSEDSVDLCDVLASYNSRAKVSLDLTSKALALAGKPSSITGADVERLVSTGRIGEVADYCETDVVNTYRLWLLAELFRGRLSQQTWQASEKNLEAFVTQRLPSKSHLKSVVEQTQKF
jgi:3'-5' exonuclease